MENHFSRFSEKKSSWFCGIETSPYALVHMHKSPTVEGYKDPIGLIVQTIQTILCKIENNFTMGFTFLVTWSILYNLSIWKPGSGHWQIYGRRPHVSDPHRPHESSKGHKVYRTVSYSIVQYRTVSYRIYAASQKSNHHALFIMTKKKWCN